MFASAISYKNDMAMDFAKCQDESIYLDNASTTFPKPEEVYEFMNTFYRQFGVNPGRSQGCAFMEAEKMVMITREKMTRFFNGKDPKRLIFAYNCTDAMNMAIGGILHPGDHVITTNLEHNCVLRPLHHLIRDRKIEVDFVPFNEQGFIIPADIERLIKKNTRLVVVNHGSNVLGTLQPLAEIGEICQKNGLIFISDTAQTAGLIPIDIEKLHLDIVVFTGHKSLLGPMGIGGMYVREGIDINPTRYGGTGVLSEMPFQPMDFPYRLESGTINLIGVAGLYAAMNYIENIGLEYIHAYEMELFDQLCFGLKSLSGIKIYGSTEGDNHLPLISINFGDKTSTEVGDLLATKYAIYSRCGLHCAPQVHQQLRTIPRGTVRLAIGPMNESRDIEITLKALYEISKS